LSNLTLGSGIMPLTGYLAAGVRVGIGSDAANCGGRHDLFELMRLALTLPRVAEADFHHWPSAAAILEMATANGSRIVRNAAEPAGIVPGAAADLVLVRRDNALTLPLVDNVEAFVSQAGRDAVEAVMIAGRWVLSDNRILSFDEARVMREVADAHAAVAERSAAMLPEIDRALETLALQVLPWLQPL